MLGPADTLHFESFRLDRTGLFRLDQAGITTPVLLGSRALDLLGLLAGRCGELISKDEIMQAVWPRIVVEENNLTVQISALRRILDAGRPQGSSCIQNVPGRGYRFVAAVTRVEPTVPGCPSTLGDKSSSLNVVSGPSLDASTYPQITASSSLSKVRVQKQRWSSLATTLMAALGLLLILVTAVTWHPTMRKENSAPRLSIVVLPFTNLSDDREQQYFTDGITDDLTTDLSQRARMVVISRNTAFTYKDKPVDTKQISRELGVRYLLEGSVRRSGNLIRVNAQLIAAETDTHLWAENFDYDVGDLLALQREITGRIANTLNAKLVKAEAVRPLERPEALDYILRGRAAWFKPHTRESYGEVIGWFERALALDPHSGGAQGWMASALIARVLDQMSDSPARDIDRAELLSTRALEALPNSPLAHYAKAQVLRVRKRYEEALSEYEEVLTLDPNWVNALHGLSVCKLLTGSIEGTILLEERAIRLSPRDSRINIWYTQIGLVHLLQSRTDQAIVWLEKARSSNPGRPAPHALLASAYALKGEKERAFLQLTEARKLRGERSFSSIADIKANTYFGIPAIRSLYEATYLAGLHKAGIPEE
jgi:TolB-like protein/DNA-binding winged helix-turn-helix (wHTH) protein/Tfp pilus assembly protein PilF